MGSWVQAQHEMVGSFYKFDSMKFLQASNANLMAIWFARLITLGSALLFLHSLVKNLTSYWVGCINSPEFLLQLANLSDFMLKWIFKDIFGIIMKY